MGMTDNRQLAEYCSGALRTRPSVYLYLEDGLKANPDGLAAVVLQQRPDYLAELLDGNSKEQAGKSLSWTFREIHGAALRVAAALMAHDVRPGGTIMTALSNGIEFSLMIWTCAILKMTLCGIDPLTLQPQRQSELENFLRTLSPDVILVPDTVGAKDVDSALLSSALTQPQVKIRLDHRASGSDLQGWTTFPCLALDAVRCPVDAAKVLEAARKDDPSRTAYILFTSGTSSGKPKGCPRHVAASTNVIASRPWDLTEGGTVPHPRVLLATQNFRAIALFFSLGAWSLGGATIMVAPSATGAMVKSAEFLDAIERYDVTSMPILPALLHALVADPSFKDRNLDSVKSVSLGADVITKGLFRKSVSSFPKAQTLVGHGMTEVGALVRWPFSPAVPLDDIPCLGDICPLGRLAPGNRARIIDPETRTVLRRGELGELCFCSEGIIKHYIGHAHEQTWYMDGKARWFRTGDLAVMDESGMLIILGRIKDIIKRAGLGITPASLEDCITTFTKSEVVVIAVPHPELGQEPFAVLRSFNGKTEWEIKSHVLAMFGPEYALAGAASLKQLGIEDFPVTGTGKVMKTHLLAEVLKHLDQ